MKLATASARPTPASFGRAGPCQVRNLAAVVLVIVLAALAGACGSDDDGVGAKPTPSTATGSAVTAATALSSSSAPTGAEEAEVSAAFKSFFDGMNPDVNSKVALLEHGETYRSMISDAALNPQFQLMSTDVKSVRLLDAAACAQAALAAPCAEVVHDVLVGSFPAIAAKTSYAVNLGDRWVVAARSWCEVVAIGGAGCPTG